MELTTLRPEFQDQVRILRKKVVHRIKAKCLKGRELTGRIFVELANQYVQAIN